MVAARKVPPTHMTVTAFLSWNSGDDSRRIWQLHDGEPEMMPLATDVHGRLQSELNRLIGNHLLAAGRGCGVVSSPGADGTWPEQREFIAPDANLHLGCIDFTVLLRAAYRTSRLV